MKKAKIILLIFFCLSLFAIDKKGIEAKKFSIPEYDENGKLNYIIRGDQGKNSGKKVLIDGVHLLIFREESPLNLTTSKCEYSLETKRSSSSEAVKIKSDGLEITGKGFDIDSRKKKIFIRSSVKCIFKKTEFKKDNKSAKESLKVNPGG